MPDLTLTAFRVVVVDRLRVLLELGNLRVGDRQAELFLRFGQRDPEAENRYDISADAYRSVSGFDAESRSAGSRFTTGLY
jgi:hypothetical protein